VNGEPGGTNGHRRAHGLNRESPYLAGEQHGSILEDVGTIMTREMKESACDAKRQANTEHEALALVITHRVSA
jgi:hypothetical protein